MQPCGCALSILALSDLCVLCGLLFCTSRGAGAPPDRARTEALARRAGRSPAGAAARSRPPRRPRSARCSATCASSRSSARSRPRSSSSSTRTPTRSRPSSPTTTARDGRARGVGDAAERPELQARLVEIYKLGQARYLRLLLSTPDLRRIGQASRIVAALAKLDRDRIAAHAADARRAEGERARRSKDAQAQLAAASRRRRAGPGRRAARRAGARRPHPRHRQAARSERAALRRAAGRPAEAAGDAARSGRPRAPARSGPALPLAPVPRRSRLAGGRHGHAAGSAAGRRRHVVNGIEIAAAEGAAALAIHDGVVAFADTFAGFGNLVIVDHGSQTFSLYGDLLDIAVKKGARVERGQAGRHRRPDARRAGRAVLRAARRRSARSIPYNG